MSDDKEILKRAINDIFDLLLILSNRVGELETLLKKETP